MKNSKIIYAAALLIIGAGCSSAEKGNFPDSVDQSIESHQKEFNKCYDSALKQKLPTEAVPTGRVQMGFTVSPAGVVTESNVINGIGSLYLEKCIQETLRRIKFPSNKEGRLIQTTYPFDFPPTSN